MNARGLLAAAVRPLAAIFRAAEGGYRPGPYSLPVSGGWLSADVGKYLNFWQMGYRPEGADASTAIVEACVSAYAQTVAMLSPGDHWRKNIRGGRTRVTNSALSRVLRHPNVYQSSSDFLLMLMRWLYLEGNAYALAIRNNRFEVEELHLFNSRMSRPQVIYGDDDTSHNANIFYRLAGNQALNPIMGQQIIAPARDVLHIRLNPNPARHPYPLYGEPPLLAAVDDLAIYQTIMQQQLQFYNNQARPSAVLSTDLVMDKDQVQALRDRWDEQSSNIGIGKTPILTAGLKVSPWGMAAKDAQLAEMLKMSSEHVALAYRVPMQVLGMGDSSFRSTELLMSSWIATGLGFALNHIEESIGCFFGLKGRPDEYCEFSTGKLLRSETKDRIEALARGVQGGIYAPNEAREQEGLDRVPYGDEPRVQQQVVPLSAAASIPTAPGPHAPQAPPPASADSDGDKQPPKPPQPKVKANDLQRAARNVNRRAAGLLDGRAARDGRRLN
jgi:HK97 family phage portal protein